MADSVGWCGGCLHEGSDCTGADSNGYGLTEADLWESWVVRLCIWVGDRTGREMMLRHLGVCLIR